MHGTYALAGCSCPRCEYLGCIPRWLCFQLGNFHGVPPCCWNCCASQSASPKLVSCCNQISASDHRYDHLLINLHLSNELVLLNYCGRVEELHLSTSFLILSPNSLRYKRARSLSIYLLMSRVILPKLAQSIPAIISP